MSSDIEAGVGSEVVYPESDGKPMADNTLQWDWMVLIVNELRDEFRGQEVFVAGDLFWYPVEGNPRIVSAPDAMVAFGRPPGYRGSYKQWEEGGVAPQVVFEVLSPSNTDEEMRAKVAHYDRHGVEECYIIDPYQAQYEGCSRDAGGVMRPIPAESLDGWVSPRLGVRFVTDGGLKLFGRGNREFLIGLEKVEGMREELYRTTVVMEDERDRRQGAEREAEAARRDAEEATNRLDAEVRRNEQIVMNLRETADQLEAATRVHAEVLARLRAAGLNPDDFLRPTG